MVAELAAIGVLVFGLLAELWHVRRCRRVALLAFGPQQRPARWAQTAPVLRATALAATTWGLVTLLLVTPKVHRAEEVEVDELRHLMMVLDVSPSMRLDDAGPQGDKPRRTRAAEVMRSFFRRVPIEQYRISVVACYTGAKPVVMDTKDIDVVNNILADLPMEFAFTAGKTDIFAGLEQAAELAASWPPRSATVVLVSDGDTVPATGMPKMPAAVGEVLVVGVGDPKTGRFINGAQSRQDTSTLRQIALRLGGAYHNGNEKHLSSDLLKRLTRTSEKSAFEKLTRREYALIACAVGTTILALLPVLLHYWGTRWQPGVPRQRRSASPGMPPNGQSPQVAVSTSTPQTV